MNYEVPDNDKPVQGQLDPTSIPGSPDFVPPADFAERLAQPSAMSYAEEPEERIVAIEGMVALEESRVKRAQQAAVYGATGMTIALGSKGILAVMQSETPENVEILRAVIDQRVAPLAMIIGGMLVLGSTIRAEVHRGRATRAQSVFDQLSQPAKPDETY